MGQPFNPDSFVVDAGGNRWYDYVVALHDHVLNNSNSTRWDVVNFTDNGDGNDVGVTLAPSDTEENFYVNFRYNSAGNDLRATVDPEELISDPINPDTSGEAAPETRTAGRPGPENRGYHNEILVAEWPDCISMMTKNGANQHITEVPTAGRVYIPVFYNDPVWEVDGLGWYGGVPKDLEGEFTSDENDDASSMFRVPDEWVGAQTRRIDASSGTSSVGNWEYPFPLPMMVGEWNNEDRIIGSLKYMYRWYRAGGQDQFERIVSDDGEGLLFANWDNSGNQNLAIPWDPYVRPV